ncbi:hypothetical protein O6H91_13G072600 [Diphasiastrum complanatum]|uniref:Uncharacterized protein n=2 Tax=Diphasiastrum complanatum TaxID=34168 RepID=A0ACC2BVY2_DIPCM|nr:hypothetical protein O6H91_13G072600 [Diphasiastrum complanatum]KAJ7533952.1 hypothetical protein O6H91_13G072600 [Diphasiastrum complanatum]
MEEEKEINKKKKKARKKKSLPGQEKISTPIGGTLSSVGQALDKVQNNQFISAAPDIATASLLSSSSTEIPDKTSEHQKVLLEFHESISKDVNGDASSQSAQKNEDLAILDTIPSNESGNAVSDLKDSFDETETTTPHSISLHKELVANFDTNPSHESSNALSDLKEGYDEIETTPHSITLHKDNAADLSQIEIPSSTVENEWNNAPLQVTRQEAKGSHSNNGRSILSAVTLIENTSIQFSTDLPGDSETNHLKLYLEREMKTSRLLRLQISTLEELIAMRDADEARMTTHIKQLRAENAHLEKQVVGLKDMVRGLMQDRSQLLARMVAVQSGKLLSADELEASIGAPIDDQLVDESESEGTKEGSIFNSTNGSLAEKAISEPSIQDTVVATTVCKLVPEIVKPIHQKQFDTFGDSQGGSKISPVEQQATGVSATVKAEDETAVAMRSEPFSVTSDSNTVNIQVGSIVSVAGSKKEMERNDSLTEIKDIIENEENNDTIKESHALASSELHGKISPFDKHKHANISKEVHFSDAPLIGAPFRLMSFMAQFVSGADLAAKSAK